VYSTAAISFENGTIVDIAIAAGTLKYNDVLVRLSHESSTHPRQEFPFVCDKLACLLILNKYSPPYYSCDALDADQLRQWRRYLRKRLGWYDSHLLFHP
jgi:hypothetical protein